MPELIFPTDIASSDDLFVMYPTAYETTRRGSGIVVNKKIDPAGKINLPTPAQGLTLSESGNWDEMDGFQFDANMSSAPDAISKLAAHTAFEQGGPLVKLYNKGDFRNDYASLAYSGSNFRTYSFGWDLIPESQTEAENIAHIIKTIRRASLPKYNGTLISYPSMWRVYPAMYTKCDLWLTDCVITNFTVNYTPDGVLRRFTSGHPLSVNMAIEFKELYRADYEDV
jgi:hypothetical protein